MNSLKMKSHGKLISPFFHSLSLFLSLSLSLCVHAYSVRKSVVEFIESNELSYLSFDPPDMRKIQLAFGILKV